MLIAVTTLVQLAGPLLAIKGDESTAFNPGDHIEVIEGILRGTFGTIKSVRDSQAAVELVENGKEVLW